MTKWISVEDEEPEKSDSVWCYGNEDDSWGHSKERAVVDAVYGGPNQWWSDMGELVRNVTHWQLHEMPEPPLEAKS